MVTPIQNPAAYLNVAATNMYLACSTFSTLLTFATACSKDDRSEVLDIEFSSLLLWIVSVLDDPETLLRGSLTKIKQAKTAIAPNDPMTSNVFLHPTLPSRIIDNDANPPPRYIPVVNMPDMIDYNLYQ